LLGNITSHLIDKVLQRFYGGDTSKVPVVDYLAPAPLAPSHPLRCVKEKDSLIFAISEFVPEASVWLENLAGPRLSWLRAVLMSPTILRGSSYVDNPFRRLLSPRAGQKVIVRTDHAVPTGLEVLGAIRSYGTQSSSFKAVDINYSSSTGLIDVTIFEERRDVSVPLHLQFKYMPTMGTVPIHEITEGRNTRIKDFYWRLWFGDDEAMPSIDIRGIFTSPETALQAEDIEKFCAVVGNDGESFKSARNEQVQAPMDFGIVTCWKVSNFLVCFIYTLSNSFPRR
jgi:fatty acid synthase subunit alpha, fungi type